MGGFYQIFMGVFRIEIKGIQNSGHYSPSTTFAGETCDSAC
jgi:hypothetical protein